MKFLKLNPRNVELPPLIDMSAALIIFAFDNDYHGLQGENSNLGFIEAVHQS